MVILSVLLAMIFPAPTWAKEEAKEEPSAWYDNIPRKSEYLQREDDFLLQKYHPFYFAYGRPLSKLQLSFKSPLIKGIPLYFGYTQLMFWALEDDSKPFYDFTYNPELFYRLSFEESKFFHSIDFGIWGHNSNGKAGPASRSYDQVYVRLNSEIEFRRWIVRAGLQASAISKTGDENRDIQDYIGPLSFRLSFIQLYQAWIDKSEFALTAQPGGKFVDKFSKGGYQISWSFRLGGIDVVPSFYLQYYTGYTESLINYNKRVNEFRGGVIF